MKIPAMVKMLLLLITIATTSSMHIASAQVGSPFDLAPRLDTTKVIIPAAQLPPSRISSQPAQTTKRNPFDLARADERVASEVIKPPPITLPSMPGVDEIVPANVSRGTFDTILCFSLLVLLALATVLQGGPLRRMFNAALSANMLSQLQRESRKFGYILWATLGIILLGIFFFVSARQLYPDLTPYGWATLGWFVFATLGLTGLKLLALWLLKTIFPLDKPLNSYQTVILVYAGVIGLCLFPALILVCFGTPRLATGIAYLGIGIISVGYLLRSLRALGNSTRYIAGYPFHFLLYLCGLEIGPLAVAFKLLTA